MATNADGSFSFFGTFGSNSYPYAGGSASSGGFNGSGFSSPQYNPRPNVPGEEARGNVMGLHGIDMHSFTGGRSSARSRFTQSDVLGTAGGSGSTSPPYVPPSVMGDSASDAGPGLPSMSFGGQRNTGPRAVRGRSAPRVSDVTDVASALPRVKARRSGKSTGI